MSTIRILTKQALRFYNPNNKEEFVDAPAGQIIEMPTWIKDNLMFKLATRPDKNGKTVLSVLEDKTQIQAAIEKTNEEQAELKNKIDELEATKTALEKEQNTTPEEQKPEQMETTEEQKPTKPPSKSAAKR